MTLHYVKPVVYIYLSSESNIALKKPTWQSSILYNGNGAHKAVDGCIRPVFGAGGCCTQTDQNLSPWWKIDLGDIHDIFRIVITFRTDCKFTQKESRNFTSSTPQGPVQFYILPYPTPFLLVCLTDKSGGGYGKMQNWTCICDQHCDCFKNDNIKMKNCDFVFMFLFLLKT